MSNKDYYIKYDTFTSEINELEKTIRTELSAYRQKTSGQESTIQQENKIKGLFKEYKDKINNLSNAYIQKNVPGGVPQAAIIKRQGDIEQFKINCRELEKSYNNLENERYRFKDGITEDYYNKEEYKNMSTGELMMLEKNKIKKQDERLDEITLDVKKGTQLAKNAGHVMKEQNKQLDQINEDIDRTKDRMNTLSGRFERYVASYSMCKMIIVLIIELIIAVLAFILLF